VEEKIDEVVAAGARKEEPAGLEQPIGIKKWGVKT